MLDCCHVFALLNIHADWECRNRLLEVMCNVFYVPRLFSGQEAEVIFEGVSTDWQQLMQQSISFIERIMEQANNYEFDRSTAAYQYRVWMYDIAFVMAQAYSKVAVTKAISTRAKAHGGPDLEYVDMLPEKEEIMSVEVDSLPDVWRSKFYKLYDLFCAEGMPMFFVHRTFIAKRTLKELD